MQTIKERINFFLGYKKIGQAKFAELAGLSKGFANNVGDNITTKSINKIKNTFPELNTNWLLTGEGEMLKGKDPNSIINIGDSNVNSIGHNVVNTIVSKKEDKIKELEQIIEEKENKIRDLEATITDRDAIIDNFKYIVDILKKK